jgi:sporulenol synthase
MMLLPVWFPVNLFELSGHARVHLVPLMVAGHNQFSLSNQYTPDLAGLFGKEKGWKRSFSPISALIQSWRTLSKAVPFLSRPLQKKAVRKAELFMLKRLEPDGTLLTYSTSTMLMIFALLSLGYTKDSPVVQKAVDGIKTLLCQRHDHVHLQVATSTVWDTALIAHALQEAGVPAADAAVQKAVHYLVSRQQSTKADWRIHNPEGEPGGWGFSDVNTKYPDLDCTAMSLRTLSQAANNHPPSERAWNRGLDWLLSMQNEDGGWPAFEKNTDKKIMTFIPFERSADFVIDPSTPDLTGRVLQFLGEDAALKKDHPAVKKAVRWLKRQQKADGSWFGRWGISFVHGTSAAVLGLLAAGVPKSDRAIRKALDWMLAIQNEDGGWGESAISDVKKEYIPLGASTPSQTAWALEMLIVLQEKPTAEMQRGMEYFIQSLQKDEWTNTYPTGGGLPGSAYFYYPSLNDAWGLLVLAKYKHKFLS